MRTVDQARGRWRDILVRLGVESRFLVNRHGPCPLCGGKDRFRWDDKDGSGSYFCNQCGPGPGLLLLRKLHEWDYATACAEVDKIIGTCVPMANRKSTSDPSAGRLANLERVIVGATDRLIVENYLIKRGLQVVPDALRGHCDLPYHDESRNLVGYFPAVIAPVIGPDGGLQSVHRTYLADLPIRKKLMPAVNTVKGAAVRLFDPTDELGVAEGIETAIAAHEMFNLPVWAAVTAGGLERFKPPAGVSRFVIFGDNDRSFTGQKSAFALAHRLRRDRPELDIEVCIPDELGSDWLDEMPNRYPYGSAAHG